MDSLTLAYGVVWAFVAMYVGWLGVQQRRLERRLKSVQSDWRDSGWKHGEPASAGNSRAPRAA